MNPPESSSNSKAAEYNAWYQNPRGQWIGNTEFALIQSMLAAETRSSLIDIGCSTGYYTRRFAREFRGRIVGLDPDEAALSFARSNSNRDEHYLAGLGEALPFEDRTFDISASITSLCFMEKEVLAVREMVRVAKRRVVIGLLNRRSLLWRRKGRNGGSGGYAGARWHTPSEARRLFRDLPVRNVRVRSAILFPSGGRWARFFEHLCPSWLHVGAFLCVSGEIIAPPLTLMRTPVPPPALSVNTTDDHP